MKQTIIIVMIMMMMIMIIIIIIIIIIITIALYNICTRVNKNKECEPNELNVTFICEVSRI